MDLSPSRWFTEYNQNPTDQFCCTFNNKLLIVWSTIDLALNYNIWLSREHSWVVLIIGVCYERIPSSTPVQFDISVYIRYNLDIRIRHSLVGTVNDVCSYAIPQPSPAKSSGGSNHHFFFSFPDVGGRTSRSHLGDVNVDLRRGDG